MFMFNTRTYVRFAGALSIVAGIVLGAVAPAAAAAPAAAVTVTRLAAGPTAALPTAPALLGMARVTYAPGAGEVLTFGAFGDVTYVEEGTLTLRIDGEASVTRSSVTGAAGLVLTPAAGEEFTIGHGDAVYLPGGTGEIRNAGDAPAVLLVGFVGVIDGDPNAGPPASPAGVEQELLGLGMTPTLPAVQGSLILERVSFPTSAMMPADREDPSPRLIVAEAGAVRIRYDADLTVGRGAPGKVEQIAAGTEVTLRPGESALVPALAGGEVGNAGDGPAGVLVVRVQPAVTAPPQVG